MKYATFFDKKIDKNNIHHAYIIEGKYADKEEAVRAIIDKLEIKRTDIETVEGEKSISVGQIRELRKKLALAPYESEIRAAVINQAQMMTVEAQNTLLKTLEEPPGRSLIFLLLNDKEEVLGTIVSRCQIIKLDSNLSLLNEAGDDLPEEIIRGEMSVGEIFKFAEELAKKDNLAISLDLWLVKIRERYMENPQEKRWLKLAHAIQTAKKMLKSNANSRLILENLLLEIKQGG